MKTVDMKKKKEKIIVLLLILAFGISYRLMDYAPNFSPIAAIALFCGFYFKRKEALLVPLVILLISDLWLGFYNLNIMLSVYGSILLIGALGIILKKIGHHFAILGSLFGSVVFFLVTNFAVWFYGAWYESSLSGLMNCYYLALPFFRNTLLGDLSFTFILFGAYELSRVYKKKTALISRKVISK